MKRKMIIFLVVVVVAYGLMCAAMYFFQSQLLFPGSSERRRIDYVPPAHMKISTLTSEKGDRYRIAVATPKGGVKGVMLWFVGNGEDLSSGVHRAEIFRDYGLKTLVSEYPGYGESEGSPSHASILSAAESSAAKARELARELGVSVYIGGQSLGSFSAVHAVTKGYGRKLLIVSPPTSVVAIARHHYPWLPVRMLIRHPFDNLGLAHKVDIGTLVIHGDADTVVPVAMGREMARAIPEATLEEVAGGGHNNLSLERGGPLSAAIIRHFFE